MDRQTQPESVSAAQPDLAASTVQSSLEAQEDNIIPSTDANHQMPFPGITCYVCNLPGTTDRLTTCMSAPVYQHLTAHSNQQNLDTALLTSDPLLRFLLQPGKAGTLARQSEGAKHCQMHFHQSCLGRRKEAVFDNRVTAVRNPNSDSAETRVKDLRHRLCGDCLQSVHGNLETLYTGLLNGELSWSDHAGFCYSELPLCTQASCCALLPVTSFPSIDLVAV